MKKSINVDFLGSDFSSPLVLVSGVYTQNADFINCQKNGAGAITTKSYTYFPRKGHPAPVVVNYN